ncbi:hypothetical protein [Oceanobacillus bengalensis]|nr:hypothetical protein [Oceanobacillus bengalensis]
MGFIMSLVVYTIPFVILYFVIAAGVKRGIDQSEVGRMIKEKYLEKRS